MKTKTKVWLILAASLVLIGGVLFAGVMTTREWDFTKLSTVKYETNTHEINAGFDAVSINTDTADITFVYSPGENCKVECHEEEKANHVITVENNTLLIESVSKEKWYDDIGINFGQSRITVYLPETEYTYLLIEESTGDIEMPEAFRFKEVDILLSTGDVTFYASASERIKIETSTGDICVDGISAGALDLTVSTGKVTVSSVTCEGDVTVGVSTGRSVLTDIECENLVSEGDTGAIWLNHVIVRETLSIERSTGEVKLDGSDAAEIFVKTDTGDVTGSLLTEKVFITQTDTGSVDVPKTVSGGKCEITTDTGDIKIEIRNK